MKRILFALLLFGVATALVVDELHTRSTELTPLAKLRSEFQRRPAPSVDHSRFTQLQVRFEQPQQATAACIGCHNGRHQEVLRSSH